MMHSRTDCESDSPSDPERIVEVVTALHGRESQNESSHRSSTCQDTHTHTKWWRRSSKILNLTQQVATAQDAKTVSRHDQSPGEQVVNKHVRQVVN